MAREERHLRNRGASGAGPNTGVPLRLAVTLLVAFGPDLGNATGYPQHAGVGPKLPGEKGYWVKLKSLELSDGSSLEPAFTEDGYNFKVHVKNTSTERLVLRLGLNVAKYDLMYTPHVYVNDKQMSYDPNADIDVLVPLNESLLAPYQQTTRITLQDPKAGWLGQPNHEYAIEIYQPPPFEALVHAKDIVVKESGSGKQVSSKPPFQSDSDTQMYRYVLSADTQSVDVQVTCNDFATRMTYNGVEASLLSWKTVQLYGAANTIVAQCIYDDHKWTRNSIQRSYILTFNRDAQLTTDTLQLVVMPKDGYCVAQRKSVTQVRQLQEAWTAQSQQMCEGQKWLIQHVTLEECKEKALNTSDCAAPVTIVFGENADNCYCATKECQRFPYPDTDLYVAPQSMPAPTPASITTPAPTPAPTVPLTTAAPAPPLMTTLAPTTTTTLAPTTATTLAPTTPTTATAPLAPTSPAAVKTWWHEGECFVGDQDARCVGKENGFQLGDGGWCWDGRRDMHCSQDQMWRTTPHKHCAGQMTQLGAGMDVTVCASLALTTPVCTKPLTISHSEDGVCFCATAPCVQKDVSDFSILVYQAPITASAASTTRRGRDPGSAPVSAKVWWYQGTCFTGHLKDDRCVGQNNGYSLPDGSWCWNSLRDMHCSNDQIQRAIDESKPTEEKIWWHKARGSPVAECYTGGNKDPRCTGVKNGLSLDDGGWCWEGRRDAHCTPKQLDKWKAMSTTKAPTTATSLERSRRREATTTTRTTSTMPVPEKAQVWWYKDKCYDRRHDVRCQGKDSGHVLDDGGWCWGGWRDEHCPNTLMWRKTPHSKCKQQHWLGQLVTLEECQHKSWETHACFKPIHVAYSEALLDCFCADSECEEVSADLDLYVSSAPVLPSSPLPQSMERETSELPSEPPKSHEPLKSPEFRELQWREDTCYIGVDYDGCKDKEDGHDLGEGFLCWAGRRETQCKAPNAWNVRVNKKCAGDMKSLGHVDSSDHCKSQILRDTACLEPKTFSYNARSGECHCADEECLELPEEGSAMYVMRMPQFWQIGGAHTSRPAEKREETTSPEPSTSLLRAREDCWEPCQKKTGYCNWCGVGNACCRAGYESSNPECASVDLKLLSARHECVVPAIQTTCVDLDLEWVDVHGNNCLKYAALNGGSQCELHGDEDYGMGVAKDVCCACGGGKAGGGPHGRTAERNVPSTTDATAAEMSVAAAAAAAATAAAAAAAVASAAATTASPENEHTEWAERNKEETGEIVGFVCRAASAQPEFMVISDNDMETVALLNEQTGVKTVLPSGLPVPVSQSRSKDSFTLRVTAGEDHTDYPVEVIMPALCYSFKCPHGFAPRIPSEAGLAREVMCLDNPCSDRDKNHCCVQAQTCESFVYECPAGGRFNESASKTPCRQAVCSDEDALTCCQWDDSVKLHRVEIGLNLRSLNAAKVMNHLEMRQGVEQALKEAIAKAAGKAISAKHVAVDLLANSSVRAMVFVPEQSAGEGEALAVLTVAGPPLENAIEDALQHVQGINDFADGYISVHGLKQLSGDNYLDEAIDIDGRDRVGWYFGTVTSVNSNGTYTVHFDYGDVERDVSLTDVVRVGRHSDEPYEQDLQVKTTCDKCEANGHPPDACDCGFCGSWGDCVDSCNLNQDKPAEGPSCIKVNIASLGAPANHAPWPKWARLRVGDRVEAKPHWSDKDGGLGIEVLKKISHYHQAGCSPVPSTRCNSRYQPANMPPMVDQTWNYEDGQHHLCYYDESCSRKHPGHYGLGCSAGGNHQNCRFCGFGVYAPCPFAHDCSNPDINSWPQETKDWCCDHYNLGCKYDCRTNESLRQRNLWEVDQTVWCCKHAGLGCPYDCNDMPSNQSLRKWSKEKGEWCCAHNTHTCSLLDGVYKDYEQKFDARVADAGIALLGGCTLMAVAGILVFVVTKRLSNRLRNESCRACVCASTERQSYASVSADKPEALFGLRETQFFERCGAEEIRVLPESPEAG